MKTTRKERDRLRESWLLTDYIGKVDGESVDDIIERLLDDADLCEELESRPRRPNKSQAELIADHDRAVARVSEIEAVLRAVDAALENEFGGFYLSAPEGDPMGDIREMLRGER